ncbi:dorsal-ventral patterning protein tolloid, partial [Biomphalaria glabrata]
FNVIDLSYYRNYGCNDFLVTYDGPSIQYLSTWVPCTGNNFKVRSTRNEMLVMFRSGSQGSSSGFLATYKAL